MVCSASSLWLRKVRSLFFFFESFLLVYNTAVLIGERSRHLVIFNCYKQLN